jgi:hypothetical protein
MNQRTVPVYTIDESVLKPGHAKRLFESYLARYAPGAASRGMRLEHSLVEPAFWTEDGSNRLVFICSLPGVGAVWGKNFADRAEPEVAAWWSEVDSRCLSRRRSTLCEGADVVTVTDV